MRILMITPNFPPELSPEAIVNGKLVLALRGRGAHVHVVTRTMDASNFSPDDSECWRQLPSVTYLAPRWTGRGEKAATYFTRLRRLYSDCSWFVDAAAAAGEQLFAEQPFDVILTRSGSVDGLVVGRLLQRRLRRPWFATINDPLPLCLYPPPYGPGRPVTWRDRYEARRLAELLPFPDRVLFPCWRLGHYLERRLGANLGDRVLVSPHIGWQGQGSSRPNDRFQILYAGSMGLPRVSAQMLLDFFRLFRNHPECEERLTLVFLGQLVEPFIKWVREAGLEKFISLERPVGYESSLERISRASALLLMEGVLAEGIFFPSKFADYAVAGKPLLMFSPEPGTIADFVGGRRHPGFWGQDRGSYLGPMENLLAAIGHGDSLEDFLHSTSADFFPETVGDALLAAMT